MKLKGLIVVSVVGASLMATAGASANTVHTFYTPGQHACHNRHGSLTASPYTSCAFGNAIANSFFQWLNYDNCSRYDWKCGGAVWSRVTRRWYHVTCLASSRPVTCYSNGHQSWVKFYVRWR